MKLKKLVTLLFLSLTLSGCYETETGTKIGTIVKIGKQGVFFKTNEAELIRGRITDGSGSFGSSFHFTIESKEMVEKLQDAMDRQQEVKIHYHKELATLCRTETDDNSFLDSVEVINQ